mmetsp:Transcript_56244/g.168408  ORF Transcript_56244/g.168408 Transcript_56244/m.168408 type:complete len:149 (-) Transcript_56244:131-577(-)
MRHVACYIIVFFELVAILFSECAWCTLARKQKVVLFETNLKWAQSKVRIFGPLEKFFEYVDEVACCFSFEVCPVAGIGTENSECLPMTLATQIPKKLKNQMQAIIICFPSHTTTILNCEQNLPSLSAHHFRVPKFVPFVIKQDGQKRI